MSASSPGRVGNVLSREDGCWERASRRHASPGAQLPSRKPTESLKGQPGSGTQLHSVATGLVSCPGTLQVGSTGTGTPAPHACPVASGKCLGLPEPPFPPWPLKQLLCARKKLQAALTPQPVCGVREVGLVSETRVLGAEPEARVTYAWWATREWRGDAGAPGNEAGEDLGPGLCEAVSYSSKYDKHSIFP